VPAPPGPGNSRGGPLTTDRRPAENPGEKFTSHGTPNQRQDQARHDEAHQHVRGTFVVVVETPGDKYRRRCFLTLASAEAAVARAEAKGYSATVVLARLEPVAGWSA